MANTITGLLPDAYAAIAVVSREATGAIPSVARHGKTDRAATGQQVKVPIPRSGVMTDITPAMAIPSPADQVVDHVSVSIDNNKTVPFGFTGDETAQLDAGPGQLSVQAGMIAEAMRTLVNAIETDVAKGLALAASRAYGTAGTTAFASALTDSAQLRRILTENGAPPSDRSIVVNSMASASLMGNTGLNWVNQAGNDSMLRQGVLLNMHGASIRETGFNYEHTSGGGTGYLANGAMTEGSNTITIDTGTGGVSIGDVISFAGSTNKYVVATALASGSCTIHNPGLREDVADGVAMTVSASYSSSVALSRNAFVLASRLPDLPKGGDAAERAQVFDSRSGLTFDLAMYKGFHANRYDVSTAWGVKAIQPEHIALSLG